MGIPVTLHTSIDILINNIYINYISNINIIICHEYLKFQTL